MSNEVPWRRILLEGFVIVASILLAFSIDAWWEGVQARGAEQEILAGLETDFAANEEHVEVQLRLRESLVAMSQLLTDQLQTAGLATEIQVADSVLIGLLTSPTFDPTSATLEASISSGQIALVQSPAVREHLADWRRILVGLHENELAVRDVVHSLLVPELSNLTRLGPAASALAAPREMGDLPRPSEMRSIQATSRLEGAIGLYLFNSTLVARDLRDLQSTQRALLTALETEMAK